MIVRASYCSDIYFSLPLASDFVDVVSKWSEVYRHSCLTVTYASSSSSASTMEHTSQSQALLISTECKGDLIVIGGMPLMYLVKVYLEGGE